MKKGVTDKIERLIQAAGELKPGSVTHIDVKHLDGCPAIRTQCLKDCTCDPSFKVMRPDA
jgi:hypothetical protein